MMIVMLCHACIFTHVLCARHGHKMRPQGPDVNLEKPLRFSIANLRESTMDGLKTSIIRRLQLEYHIRMWQPKPEVLISPK